MKSEAEIIEALQTIKETCVEHDDCSICPLRDEGEDCGIHYGTLPDAWKIAEPEESRRLLL